MEQKFHLVHEKTIRVEQKFQVNFVFFFHLSVIVINAQKSGVFTKPTNSDQDSVELFRAFYEEIFEFLEISFMK